jgi:hypothetical protein
MAELVFNEPLLMIAIASPTVSIPLPGFAIFQVVKSTTDTEILPQFQSCCRDSISFKTTNTGIFIVGSQAAQCD